jgi:hypothetical protein
MTSSQIPHLRIIVAVSAFVLIGFGAVSTYVLGWSDDAVTKGNIIGTWQNFALLAVGFWIGSSSAGKAKDAPPAPESAKEAAEQVAGAATDEAEVIGRN